MSKQAQLFHLLGYRPFLRNYGWTIALLGLLSAPMPTTLAQVSAQDQAAIAQTREMAIQAINTRDFSKVEPYLHPSFTITTVDNHVFHKVQEFEQYWNQQFTASIEKIAMDVKVDPTRVFLSPQTEVAYGDAIATFYFRDGKVRPMAMRWTAVLQKFQGKWTIQSLHFSSNLLNNPVLGATQQMGRNVAIATGIGGLLVGAVIVGIWQRRPRPSTERV